MGTENMCGLIILSGCTGAGKTTLIQLLLEHLPCRVIPKFTTRQRRKNENNEMVFVKKIPKQCNFSYQFYPNSPYYGFSIQHIEKTLANGFIAVTDIASPDVIMKLRKRFDNVRTILVERDLTKEGLLDIYHKRGDRKEDFEPRLANYHFFQDVNDSNRHIFDLTIQNKAAPIDMFNELMSGALGSCSEVIAS